MQGWIDNPKGLQKFLGGLCPSDNADLVRVDRSIRPAYPDWVEKILYPVLEATGPAEFDAGKLEQWLHDIQKNGVVEGNIIHDHIKEHVMLEGCLGRRDLEEIRKKGITFFRKHFKGKVPFGWKSVVQHCDGNLYVPYLYEGVGEVVFGWFWLGNGWLANSPALRFAS